MRERFETGRTRGIILERLITEHMARTGIRDVFVINQVVRPEKIRAAALLAREMPLKIAVDYVTNVKALSDAAKDVGSVIGCVIEVDSGIYRCGVKRYEIGLLWKTSKARQSSDIYKMSILLPRVS
jgi:D-serine deaminase-like pyridoxal phosphate-dependent protein